MKKLLLPVIFYLIYIICRADLNLDALLPGDLLFQVERSAYADAIADATAQDSVSYCHVGIYAVVDSLPVVVEAIPRGGVTVTPLEKFAEGVVRIDAIRISLPGVPDAGAQAAAQALSLVGRPYDWRFAVGDSAIYCSELVQMAYRQAAGREVFDSQPMNFLDADGRLSDFWVEVFNREGCPVPQGAPGTNPNVMARTALSIGSRLNF